MAASRACRAMKIDRSWRHRPGVDKLARDAAVIARLNEVVAKHGRWGFWKCFDRLRTLGHAWNHKRVYRVYCALGLNQVRRTKKRVPTREVVPLHAPPQLNTTWAMDFMGDSVSV